MAKIIFGAHPGLGLILLPVLLYHPLQLIVCGALASRWGRQSALPGTPVEGASAASETPHPTKNRPA